MSTSVFHRLGQGVEHTCVCEGREGASGNVVGGREPQGILWVEGSLFGNVNRVCVFVCVYMCEFMCNMYICMCVCK